MGVPFAVAIVDIITIGVHAVHVVSPLSRYWGVCTAGLTLPRLALTFFTLLLSFQPQKRTTRQWQRDHLNHDQGMNFMLTRETSPFQVRLAPKTISQLCVGVLFYLFGRRP